MNNHHDYTINERSRRFRTKRKLEREAAQKIADQASEAAATVARIQHRKDLDATRAAKGLPPSMTSTERSRKTRAAQKLAREAAEAKARATEITPLSELTNLIL
jgi:hypothetical protein